MALSPTNLVNAVVLASQLAGKEFGKAENRLSEYGIFNNFEQNTDRLLPAELIKSLRASERRPVDLPFLNKRTPTINTVRACTRTLPEKTSQFFTITWVTKTFTVGVQHSEHSDNYFSEEASLADQLLDGIKAIYEELDADAETALEAGKTTAFPYTTYTNAGGAYQVLQADKNELYQNIPALLKTHDLPSGLIQDVTGTKSIVAQNFLQSQGQGNSENQGFAFGRTEGDNDLARRLRTSNFEFFHSNRVTDAALVDQTHWFITPGSTAVIPWIDIDSRRGSRIHEGERWFKAKDPVFGKEWGVKMTSTCVNGSGRLAGTESTMQTVFEYSLDYAFFTAPTSTDDNPIIKVEITDA